MNQDKFSLEYACTVVVPGSGVFLSKNAKYEVAFAVWLERRGNNDVFIGWQFETAAHLTHVYEGVTHGHGSLTQQDVRAEVNVILTFILRDKYIHNSRKPHSVVTLEEREINLEV